MAAKDRADLLQGHARHADTQSTFSGTDARLWRGPAHHATG
jgi:hypothetical protein